MAEVDPKNHRTKQARSCAKPRRTQALTVPSGARIATGGERGGGTSDGGFFFRPTVLADVPLEARIGREIHRVVVDLLGVDESVPGVRETVQATLEPGTPSPRARSTPCC